MPNTPVSINPPSTTSVPLDTPKTIGLSISDADWDIPGATYTVSLMPVNGTLSLGADSGITYYPEPIIGFVDMTNIDPDMDIFSAPPPGSLFIGGSFADINAALATLTFTPTPGYTGTGEIEMIVSDHAEGGDSRTSDYEAITLSIGGNGAPTITSLDGDTLAYAEEDPASFVDIAGNALITDDNANFDGGSLTIAILNRDYAEDILLFDANVVLFNENDNGFNDVIVDGVVIGEMPLEYGTPYDDLVITFNSEATAARVMMLLRAVTYNNLDFVDPTEGTRTIEYTLTDGSGPDAQTTTVHSFITVTDTLEINRPALLDLNGAAPGVDVVRSYTEGGAAIQLAPAATSDDPDLLPYNGGSLTIAVDGANAGDQLTIVNGGGVVLEAGGAISVNGSIVVASYSGGTNGTPLVLNFLPVGSVADTPEYIVDELVRAIRYSSTSDAPDASRTVTFTLNDGGGTDFGGIDTAVATATVTITAVDDKPVVIGSGVSLAAILEDSANPGGQTVSGTVGTAFSDPDGHSLAGVAITGNAATTQGVWQYFDGGSWVTIGAPSATSALVLAADTQLRFVPAANFAGEAPALTARLIDDSHGAVTAGSTIDLGVHGSESQYSSGSLAIGQTVTNVNDAPSGADHTVTMSEGGTYTFQLSDFGFSDALDGDAMEGIFIATQPGGGQILFGGMPLMGGDVPASLIDIGFLTYYAGPDANGTGYASFTFQVRDSGRVDHGGVDTDPTPNTITFNIVPVDDLPVAVADGPSLDADVATDIAVVDNDIDIDGGPKGVIEINGSAVSVGVPVTLASGAAVTLNADGTIGYDPNGAFDWLVSPATALTTGSANGSATDSFTYTLNGGSSATVSVTVNGIDEPGDTLFGTELGNAITGTAGNDLIRSREGNDTVSGGDGDDMLYGGNGDDVLQGGDGNDVLMGNLGDDAMAGGLGNDVYYVGQAGDVVSENPGEGTDLVRTQIDYTLTDNVENLVLSAGARAGTGNGLGNTIWGSGGADTLSGLAGDDTLRGREGRDTLLGGDGEDLIDGGAGKDTLTGGGYRDMFQFRDGDMGASRPLADVITDFDKGEHEKIQLNLVDADSNTAGDQAFSFLGTGAFTGTAGELRYNVLAGTTWISADTNGDGAADWYIGLTGVHALTASDFTL